MSHDCANIRQRPNPILVWNESLWVNSLKPFWNLLSFSILFIYGCALKLCHFHLRLLSVWVLGMWVSEIVSIILKDSSTIHQTSTPYFNYSTRINSVCYFVLYPVMQFFKMIATGFLGCHFQTRQPNFTTLEFSLLISI